MMKTLWCVRLLSKNRRKQWKVSREGEALCLWPSIIVLASCLVSTSSWRSQRNFAFVSFTCSRLWLLDEVRRYRHDEGSLASSSSYLVFDVFVTRLRQHYIYQRMFANMQSSLTGERPLSRYKLISKRNINTQKWNNQWTSRNLF